VLIGGIIQGRKIFSNINKYIKCTLASNFGNFYSIAIISLFIVFLPMLPIQILLGNLLSDFPLIAIATDSVDLDESRRPKLYRLNQVLPLIVFLALISTIFDFIFFGIFHHTTPANIQTLWFIESILTEIALIFSIRTRNFFLKAKKPSNALLGFTLADAILIVFLPFTYIGQNFFHFVAPPITYIFIVFGLVITYFMISEIIKLFYFRHWQSNSIIVK
jgi:P-type Mg2+ transporter